MTPGQLEDLRRFANEGFPAVGRLLDAYESAQAELAAVRGGKMGCEACAQNAHCVHAKHGEACEDFLARDHAVAAVPEGKVLVDAGELEALNDMIACLHMDAYCRGFLTNFERQKGILISVLRASQRPGQGGNGAEDA